MAEDQTNTEDQTTVTGDDQVEGDETQAEDQEDMSEIEEGGEDEQDVDFDDDDLRNLSDEERAAIMGEDDEAGDEAEVAKEDEAPAAEEAAQEDEPQNAEAEDQPQPQEEPAEPEVDLGELQQAVSDATEQKRTEAFDKYEDGELTREEYLNRLKAIDQEATQELDFTRRKMAFTTETKRYFSEAPDLLADEHIDRIDYHVRQITQDDAFDALSPRQVLELAHSRYLADAAILGREVPAIPGKATPAAELKVDTPAPAPKADPKPTGKRPEPPITLANAPAATITNAADGKYSQLQAAIDNADAETLERIMGSMTEDEREAFASMDI